MTAHYAIRHWRGELPLALSGLVNGALLSAMIGALWLGLDPLAWLAANGTRPTSALIGLAGLAAFAAVPAWQCTGLWRAAARAEAGGRVAAARAGQAGATVFMLGLIVQALSVGGHAWPAAQAALHLGPYRGQLEMLRAGRELRVSGGVGLGVAGAVRDAARDAPLRRLRLATARIHPAEARRLAEFVAGGSLNTYAETDCGGACVSILLAGRHRSLRRGARLVLDPAGQALAPAQLARAGVAPWFIARWRQVPVSWAPPPALLKQAGLIHAVIGPREPRG